MKKQASNIKCMDDSRNSKFINVAIYTGDFSYITAKGIWTILQQNNEVKIAMFVNNPKTMFLKKIASQLGHLKKNGLYRVAEILNIVCRKIYRRFIMRHYECWGGGGIHNYLELLKADDRISIHHLDNINSVDSVAKIKLFKPYLGLSIAAPILKKQVLDIAKKGNLNLHKGKLPNYRGMPPAFWEVYNNEKSVSCSVHFMNELLDQGDIILEAEIPIERWSTPKGLQIKLDELGIQLLAQSLELFISDQAPLIKQKGQGSTYSKPSIKQNKDLIKKLSAKDDTSLTKRVIKTIVFNIYSLFYAPIRSYLKGALGRQDVIILLYHRVNDSHRDSLTVGVEQFFQQMSYVSQHFPVASLEALITGEVSRFEKKPIIIVSFDDGYLDNYENAYPICCRCNIPASFFVSTDMIDSGNPFPHDQKVAQRLYNMTWQQLKEMKENGMYIGSHTCSHINCVDVELKVLEDELEDSQEILNKKLGDSLAILAYPFGGEHHFNDCARTVAVNKGYSAILSAYGGINSDVDLLNLKRGGIDWKYNQVAFKARLFGWKQ